MQESRHLDRCVIPWIHRRRDGTAGIDLPHSTGRNTPGMKRENRLQHILPRPKGSCRSPGSCRDELLAALSLVGSRIPSAIPSLPPCPACHSRVSARATSPPASVALIDSRICRYSSQPIHPIDCNSHPRRGDGRNIKAIKADLDLIRAIRGTASGASPLPRHLHGS